MTTDSAIIDSTALSRRSLDGSREASPRPAGSTTRPASPPAKQTRDLRVDLFFGIATWFIFLDHIPNNIVNLITIRNFGFSGAADVFVFLSGYTSALVFGRMMLERGFIVGATRILSRAWKLYAAYVVLFVIYIVAIGTIAQKYATTEIITEFNVAGLIDHPIRMLGRGLMLQSRALNMDVLQLYIFLTALFAPVLWMLLRYPKFTMAGSLALYFAARQFEWNMPSFPEGTWYYNPFCWQLLFLLGAWFAVGHARHYRSLMNVPAVLVAGIAFLGFAFVMTMAGHFPSFGARLPSWLFDAFIPNDKMNLAPYRLLHFAVLAALMARFTSKNWSGLRSPVLAPAIICGQQSVAVFCVGVFLSFAGDFIIDTSSGSLLVQVLVSTTGIAIMTLVAYYISWSKRQG